MINHKSHTDRIAIYFFYSLLVLLLAFLLYSPSSMSSEAAAAPRQPHSTLPLVILVFFSLFHTSFIR